MTARWILHVDLDQFLAAVEVRRHPELRGRPVVVGGSDDPTTTRTVVTCASYEARTFGVHAGMPLRSAVRRCPEAVFIKSDNAAYEAASAVVMDLLRDIARVEELGWDEAFLAVDTNDPEEVARGIQDRVRRETGLSCSIGIGDSKPRAKTATGFAKPAGVHRLTVEDWMPVMGQRPTAALWGVGQRTATSLAGLGIHTVADLATADVHMMASRFGPRIGPWLILLGRGIGDTDVVTEPREPKGRSKTVTFPSDLVDSDEIAANVAAIARDVGAEVTSTGRSVRRVAVTVRTRTFYTRTKIRTLPSPTTDVAEIEAAALFVLSRFPPERAVRMLSVRVEFPAP